MVVSIYIEVDSTSAKPSEKWYGYVLECSLHGRIHTREGFGHMTGTYHQIQLQALAAALDRMKEQCEIKIYSRDTFILNMISHNLVRWAENGFLNAKGKPLANREEWIRIWETKQHMETHAGKHAYSEWLSTELSRRKEQHLKKEDE